jgi:outer membrane protein OmpA-like peptidoglycan-associated protein
MQRLSIRIVLIGLCVLLLMGTAEAQKVGGRWALGLMGGGNSWINDMNMMKFGPGGAVSFRYGVSDLFSLGAQAGYEVLKTGQDPPIPGLPYTYLRIDGIPISLSGYLRLAPSSVVSPYLRIGGGIMFYNRKTSGGSPAPDNLRHSTYIVPVGIGIEGFASNSVAIGIDLGATNFSDGLELRDNNSMDGYVSAKLAVQFFFGKSDADDDDQDGVTNGQERRVGTNPQTPDTDGDGLPDGDEIKKYKTNPLRTDTDSDGLSDGDEIMKYQTSPTKYDSDGDGLPDGEEVAKYHTEPTKPDTDGDGLTDGDEVRRYHTDPLKVDSDGDGISDSDEVKTHRTDPVNPDSDGDGLTDGEEVTKYRTNPLKPDSDGGGMIDGAEAIRKTNPLDPKDDIVKESIVLERGKAVVLKGINFKSGSATLTKDSEGMLEKAYTALVTNGNISVEVAGYTDNVGAARANERLSQRRADAVRSWLIGRGIPSTRLTAKGYGSGNPLASNTTADGRAQNRRIEFHVK